MDEMETVDTGFDDFESALFAGDYQTEGEDGTETTETNTEEVQEKTSTEEETASEGEEESQEEHTSETGEEGAEEEETPADQEGEETFTIRVNKQDVQLTRAQMIENAQKGMDYDRVKGQLTESRTEIQNLQNQLKQQSGILDVLSLISEKTNKTPEELAVQLYVNFRKSGDKPLSEDAAKLELENMSLKKKMEAAEGTKAQEKAASDDLRAKAAADLADFRKKFPDVPLTEELAGKLKADVNAGMSMANAYQKMLNEQKAAELAERQRKMDAEEQNRKNRAKSPGSQQDSGSRRVTSDADIFEKALFG